MNSLIEGIVVYQKPFNEKNFLIGVLTVDSIYLKGWVESKNVSKNVFIGQKIIFTSYTNDNTGFSYFKILDTEENLIEIFMNDWQKMLALNKILESINQIKENVEVKNLYNELKNILIKLKKENDLSLIDTTWQNYLNSMN